ncbi:MAG: phospholipid/cholesterol/gamma-HCH transport system substrate-binding protein, partial [Thermoleophilaceae bacterium]|nr:phospholipid/cholesterol/gamma-HCH transport system substrate-binding protein [Thermoleophilaceae bacterium]
SAAIPKGGEIPATNVTPEVDLDEVLNALDPQVQQDLKTATQGAGSAFSGPAGKQLNAAIGSLNPALSQTAAVERELLLDQPAFERFILESADVVTAVSTRSPELPRLVADTHGTLDAIAQRTGDLDTALRRLPPTLRQTNTTLVNLRGAIGDLRPTVRLARPVAPLLAGFLTDLQPTARQARPVVADLRRTIDSPGDRDLLAVLRGLVPVARAGVPALRSADATVRDALPILTEIRPYTPDLVGGLLNGFGGTTGGYYDANGHFARISFQSSVYSGQGLLSLLPAPNSSDGLAGFRRGVLRRCPGAATQSAPDGSNPYVADPASCSTGDNPK